MTTKELLEVALYGAAVFLGFMAGWFIIAHPIASFFLALLGLTIAGHAGGGVPYR